MSKEVPLQVDMFSGELIDTRTRKQKHKAAERKKPRQMEMFSQREMAQFGVNPHPKLPLSPKTRLELVLQDMRTEEEKERDFQREVERRSYRLPGFESNADEIDSTGGSDAEENSES